MVGGREKAIYHRILSVLQDIKLVFNENAWILMLYMQLGEEEEERRRREGAKHDTMTRRIKKNSRLCTSLPRAQSKSFVTETKKKEKKRKETTEIKLAARSMKRRGKYWCKRGRVSRVDRTTSIMHKREIGPHYRHAAASRLISRHSFCANAHPNANV